MRRTAVEPFVVRPGRLHKNMRVRQPLCPVVVDTRDRGRRQPWDLLVGVIVIACRSPFETIRSDQAGSLRRGADCRKQEYCTADDHDLPVAVLDWRTGKLCDCGGLRHPREGFQGGHCCPSARTFAMQETGESYHRSVW